MTIRDTTMVVTHEVKRVVQTPRAFSNWAAVLGDMARERFGRGPAELSFVTRSGLRINCPNQRGARVPIYEIFAEDTYRLDWFLGPLRQRPIQVIDIGGHVGTFACSLAQFHPEASVRSYEPSPTTAGYLRGNVLRNAFGERITVVEAALAAETGFAVFDDNGGGSGTNGLVSAGHTTGTATKVATIAFDEAVASAAAPVDVVKMDCEGGEYDLVRGSADASWESVRRLVLEYHDIEGESWTDLRAHFTQLGLRVVRDEPVTERLGTAWLSRDPLG